MLTRREKNAWTTFITKMIHKVLAYLIKLHLLTQYEELERANYEAIRQQQEQVMMLRHDMAKHLNLLRQMTTEPQVSNYLDELIGQNEKIRPVIQSGNELIDISLNSRLTVAINAGVRIEIVRMQPPKTLPLPDAEFCSLIMNVMDNAVAAASGVKVEQPYIKLDLHIKNDFFVFSCKNSTTLEWMKGKEKKATLPKHGLGLKIIQQISQCYGILLETEYNSGDYKVILAIPLNHLSK